MRMILSISRMFRRQLVPVPRNFIERALLETCEPVLAFATACLVFCCTDAYAGNTNVFVFQSIDALVKWQLHAPFTNGMFVAYPDRTIRWLETNFITNLSNELAGESVDSLVRQQPSAGFQKTGGDTAYAVALCTETV
jgi:hypothetical protein